MDRGNNKANSLRQDTARSVVMWRWMRLKAPELDLEGIYEELDKPQGRILGGGVPE